MAMPSVVVGGDGAVDVVRGVSLPGGAVCAGSFVALGSWWLGGAWWWGSSRPRPGGCLWDDWCVFCVRLNASLVYSMNGEILYGVSVLFQSKQNWQRTGTNVCCVFVG